MCKTFCSLICNEKKTEKNGKKYINRKKEKVQKIENLGKLFKKHEKSTKKNS